MNLIQRCQGLMSLSRKFLISENNVRLLSTQIQSDQIVEKQTEVQEKDKLYSHLEVEVSGIEPAVMQSYSWFATTAANHLGIKVGNCFAQRKPHHERKTLLKSVHIYKKHRVQYEVRTYFRFMNFHNLTQSTLETFLEYIQRNLPEGCALKVTKVELQPIPDHLLEEITKESAEKS